MNISWEKHREKTPRTYLHFGSSTLVANEQQVALAIDEDLLLEPTTFGRLLLHVGSGEIAMHQG